MYLMIKDHKVVVVGKLPASRAVISNNQGMGVHLANLVSDLVEPTGHATATELESISTEDYIAREEQYNRELLEGDYGADEGKNRLLLGADAEALFPSLDASISARIVNNEFVKSDLKVEGVDYLELSKYVSMNWCPGKIKIMGLSRVCPVRRHKFGPRPGVKGKEACKKDTTPEEESQWTYRTLDQSDLEKRRLIGAALEIAITTSFKQHIYTFRGEIYKQQMGDPIGSRLTMAVSRVVMNY